MIYVIDVLMFF